MGFLSQILRFYVVLLFSAFSVGTAFAVPFSSSHITFFQTENTHSGQAGSAERNQARIDGILYLLSQPGEVPAALVNQMKADMAEAGRLFEAGDLDGAARIMGRMQAGILTATTGAAGAVQLSAAGARALAKITGTPIAYRQITAMGAEVTSADLPTGFTRVAHPNGDIVIMAPDGRVYASVDEIVGRSAEATMWNPVTGPGPLGADIAMTFRSATYSERVLDEPLTLYRVYGGRSGELGPYWTAIRPTGGLQSQLDSALLTEWGNTVTNTAIIRVPRGTTIFEGAAAPQTGALKTYENLMGGGNQVYIPRVDPSWLVK